MKGFSCIVTAAGKNRRMREDLQKRGMEIRHKLLLDLDNEPIICFTLKRALQTKIDECIVVLGHFQNDLRPELDVISDKRVRIIENEDVDVELSETLLNGVKEAKYEFCLCLAGDQPTVTAKTMQNLIDQLRTAPKPEETVTILSRGETGYLKSAKGLGMPFACHSRLLKKYLHDEEDNLNPILRRMVSEGVSLFAVPPENDLELININKYDDYLLILEKMNLK